MPGGDILRGRYHLERTVGLGAAGAVYRAIDRERGAIVAVKQVRLLGPDRGLRRRVEREARILAGIDHPRVVRLLDHGEDDGAFYLVFEWLEGRDLAADAEARVASAKEPLRRACEIGAQAAEGLGAVHRLGVVHRDVKPENLFLVEGPGVDLRILDFGVAKPRSGLGGLTHAGAILGTPSYMAPEQAQGASEVDARADVFSLGVVLFELLGGASPWRATSDLARLARILVEDVRPLTEVNRDVPAPVSALVGRMLDRDPAGRPPMAEVEATLRAALPRNREPASPPVAAAAFETDVETLAGRLSLPERDAPFVREALREDVEAAVRAALAARRRAALLVVGPAGIGKSALGRQLEAALCLPGGPRVWRAAARAEEALVTGAFLARALRGLGALDRSPSMAALERLVPSGPHFGRLWTDTTPGGYRQESFGAAPFFEPLARIGDAEPKRDSVLALLAEWLGLGEAASPWRPGSLRAELERALEVVLRGLAEPQGLVVVADEAQQLDPVSASVLGNLLRHGPELPLVFVGLGPKAVLDRDLRRNLPEPAQLFEVPPLEDESVQILVSGQTFEKIVSIHRENRCNPLFLRWAAPLAGPSTVAAAVSDRIAALPSRLRGALTAVAVFESVCPAEAVEPMLGPGGADAVAELARGGWLSAAEDGFELTHPVVRTVALSRVPRTERRSNEASAARLLDSLGAKAAVVARHLGRAGADGDAAAKLFEAATESLRYADTAAARALAADGLDRSPKPELEAKLAEVLFEAACMERDLNGAAEALERWRAGAAGPAVEVAASRLERAKRRPAAALAAAERALDALDALDGPGAEALRSEAQFAAGRAAERLGDLARARRAYAEVDRSPRLALGLGRLAVAAGDLAGAQRDFHAAAEGVPRDPAILTAALLGQVEVHRRLGDLPQARAAITEAERRATGPAQTSWVRVLATSLLPEEERYDDALFRLDGQDHDGEPEDVRLWLGAVRGRCLRHPERLALDEARLEALVAALEAAFDRSGAVWPALRPAIASGLALAEWLLGAPTEAAERMERAHRSVADRDGLFGDERLAFDWTRARLLAAAGASGAEVHLAMRSALVELDRGLANLPRRSRPRYLDRPTVQAVLDEAGRHGLDARVDRTTLRWIGRAKPTPH